MNTRFLTKTLTAALFALLSTAIYSQSISGEVTDRSGIPLRDAYVWIGDGTRHTHSDALGRFSISNVSTQDTLLISYLGFATLVRPLNQSDFQGTVTIVLSERVFELDQVVITNDIRFVNKVAQIDLETQPVKSSQELMRRVPGLFIGQHAGGGKAEQMFLRGFDIDHGTDVRITVDGLPVNMVSHAHGQGYADLHFLIPETVESLDFGKGPYYADQGDFNTAGYVAFHTKEQLDQSSIGIEYGQFNTLRTVGLFDLLPGVENHDAYVAAEYLLTDGPFDSPQNFNRTNVMGKYTVQLPNASKLSVSASHFQSKWDASGQIPQRAISAGLINRFGAIDDTEGGNTSRSNIVLSHTKALTPRSFMKSNAFYSHYDFELYSNFTFFLNDQENGDQIRQKEDRDIFGFESAIHHELMLWGADVNTSVGIGLRYDAVRGNELSHTLDRLTTLDRIALGDVDESNVYGYADIGFNFGDWLISPGLRLDYFKFDYINDLSPAYSSLSETKMIASPKFNFIYNPNRSLQFFLKTGLGFHSNDTRVVVAQSGEEILPAAYGADLGLIWKPAPRLFVNSALWYLFLDQEFVYVGDAGVVEPSGKSRRLGVEVGLRYQLTDWLFFDTDVNYTVARAVDEPEGADYIPLAPDLTATGGISMNHPSGFSGGIRIRYIGDRPANEDDSIVAEGYAVTDVSLNYSWRKVTFGIQIENLFDTEWNEAQFATESRLQYEVESVEEIHFTPGMPFVLRGKVVYRF